MFGLKKPLERLSKHHKPSSSASASKSNPFDSDDDNKKHTLKPSNKISPQPSLPTTKKNHTFNPFDDDVVDDEVEKRSFKNHFRDSGGVENQTVQELESYAVYKSEETTRTVQGCLKVAQGIRSDATRTLVMLNEQGEKITRTHHKAVDIDHDLSRVKRDEIEIFYKTMRNLLYVLCFGFRVRNFLEASEAFFRGLGSLKRLAP